MSRELTPAAEAEATAEVKRVAVFAEIETAGDTVRLWSGLGDATLDGNIFVGVGTFGGISAPEETTDFKSTGIVFTLSGVPSALIAVAINDIKQGLPAKCWLAFLEADGTLIADPVLIFEGYAAVPTTDEQAETCTIALSAESWASTLRRPRSTRYTQGDQATRDATDKGFAYVPTLQDRKIVWGS